MESFDRKRRQEDFSGVFPPGSQPQLRAAWDFFQSWQKRMEQLMVCDCSGFSLLI